MKDTLVISAYPCCGKSYMYKNYQYRWSILDSDSSDFRWLSKEEKIENPDFPNNYIKHIQDNIGKVDIICVSSHLKVRELMTKAGIEFCTVYPERGLLDEWIGRMYRRGSDKSFIDFQIEHWDQFMKDICTEPYGFWLTRLYSNDYISNHIIEMLCNRTLVREMENR